MLKYEYWWGTLIVAVLINAYVYACVTVLHLGSGKSPPWNLRTFHEVWEQD